MRPVIFVVDADPAISRLLRRTLEAEGFAVRTFSTAESVLRLALAIRPSLFLLDMVLPDGDGLDLCGEIRQSSQWAQTPVIFVTGKASEMDRVAGLQLADDYITKPFSPLELVARVQAVLRRAEKQQTPSRLTIGDLELDGELMAVHVRGQMVSVTAQEFRLLAYLALNLGRTFRRDQLLDAVWDARLVTPRTVDVHVRRLREKIEPQPDAPRYLQTVRGKGYRLAPQAELAIPPLAPRQASKELSRPTLPLWWFDSWKIRCAKLLLSFRRLPDLLWERPFHGARTMDSSLGRLQSVPLMCKISNTSRRAAMAGAKREFDRPAQQTP